MRTENDRDNDNDNDCGSGAGKNSRQITKGRQTKTHLEKNMKNLTTQLRLASLLSLILLACTAAYGQITPLGDTYTNSADPTTNYGAQKTLDVDAAKEITYIQFNLASVPTGASISQATLKLYVNTVVTAGAFELYAVNGAWTESALTYSLAPALGSVIDSNVPITTADKNQFILIPMTSTVQGWLTTPSSNNGIALVAVGSFDATFDSKETTTTSHPPELDIVFAGGGSGITGINTAAGSGLIGGGTSGTLNLSLTNVCAASQILQWNGSAWACASPGTGTITGVTAGTDLTGGGTSGNVTLNLNTSATNGLYAQLAAANTFTANQDFQGTVLINPSPGGNATSLAVDSFNAGNAIAGMATGTGTAAGVYGSSVSSTGYGVEGTNSATTGTAVGVSGQTSSSAGYGVEGTSPYVGVFGSSPKSFGFGMVGESPSVGVFGGQGGQEFATAGLPYGVVGTSNTIAVYGASSGLSSTGGTVFPTAGVWGDYGGTELASGIGVLGTADNNWAGLLVNNSSIVPTLLSENETSNDGGLVFFGYMPNILGIAEAIIGDAGCGSGFMAVQLGQVGMSGCNNYTLMGDGGGNVYLNANSGATIRLRVNNGNQLTVTTGKVDVIGTLSKGGGSFKIDHPLDPANKYLYHSFVESPDMMNIYNGNVTTDASGEAAVELPDWFEALNRDFRYQLTVIGQFAQAIVAGKVANHQFLIKTDKPNVEVSWQVTGIRQDAFANANRIPVEAEKAPADRGRYLYPEVIGAPQTARIGYEAPPPGSEQIVHPRPALPRHGNAAPSQPRTPLSLPMSAPPMPAPPKVAASPHPATQTTKPELNQK